MASPAAPMKSAAKATPDKKARAKAEIASGTLRYLHERRSAGSHMPPGSVTNTLEGVANPDFLALGLGGTNLMAMLWAVAMGKRAVGVELRGEPHLGVHWNIREDLFHQLGLIDQMMAARYGEDDIPHRTDGKLISLADCFFSSETVSGDIVPDEIIDGYDEVQHIVGTIQHIEYIDDRYKDGKPSRTITHLAPPATPTHADPMKIRSDMQAVLDGPSTFQSGAAAIQILLRRYLDKIEEMDLERNHYPRVRLFTNHRVVEKERFGFVRQEDGRYQVRIEEVVEMDMKGTTLRLRSPGSEIIDLGIPELFSIAQGAHSGDARRLGFDTHEVAVDHEDGRGPVVAQADYIAGLFEILVDGRLRRRIASHYDEDGNEYWIRQIAVGHENDPEIAWILVQVPDNMTFDPIKAGLVAEGTGESSVEYFIAYQILLQDFYLEQAALVLDIPVHELKKVEQVYGPKIFSLVEVIGDNARVAPNGVVAGDSFGNGHFMTSAGAMTGMIGHAFRFLEYWQGRNEGQDTNTCINLLADRIKSDTESWLNVSAKEFTEAIPINFGAERGAAIAAASGIDPNARPRGQVASDARRHRHGLIPLDQSDWRRLFLKNGRVRSTDLPALSLEHPDLERWLNENPETEALAEVVVEASTEEVPLCAITGLPLTAEQIADLAAAAAAGDAPPAMMDAAPMQHAAPTMAAAPKTELDLLKEELEQLRLQFTEQSRAAVSAPMAVATTTAPVSGVASAAMKALAAAAGQQQAPPSPPKTPTKGMAEATSPATPNLVVNILGKMASQAAAKPARTPFLTESGYTKPTYVSGTATPSSHMTPALMPSAMATL